MRWAEILRFWMEPYIKGRRFSGLWRLPVGLFGIADILVLICIENFYLIIDWWLWHYTYIGNYEKVLIYLIQIK